MRDALPTLILVAGLGQLVLAAASLAIPRVLRWADDLARVRPLTRQVFWTYAGYIWATNVAFGLLSLLAPGSLLDGSVLAACVSGFITLYWFARVVIQFVYFDRSDIRAPSADIRAPSASERDHAHPTNPVACAPGWFFLFAELGLVTLFVLLVLVYGCALYVNVAGSVP